MLELQNNKLLGFYREIIMHQFKIFIAVNLALIFTTSTSAETLYEKVARNAAHCLAGHVATNSAEYQSGETGKYLLLIESIVGAEQVMPLVQKSFKTLKHSVSTLGSSVNKEGKWLVQTFCPEINDITKIKN